MPLRALAEADASVQHKALPDGSPSPSEGTQTNPAPSSPVSSKVRKSSKTETKGNVVPKEALVRAAIGLAAAGSVVSEETSNVLKKGQWVTASFDDVPDR